MLSKEQSYYVTVRKSYEVTYQLYADSFEEALGYWEEFGHEQDIQPIDSIVLSVSVD